MMVKIDHAKGIAIAIQQLFLHSLDHLVESQHNVKRCENIELNAQIHKFEQRWELNFLILM